MYSKNGGVKLRDKKKYIGKVLVIGLSILFVGASVVSGFGKNIENKSSVGLPVYNGTTSFNGSPLASEDDDWDYWTNSPNMFSNVTGNIGIGTSNPTNKLHIVGNESVPLVNIEQNGSHGALRVNSTNACAIWVENAGNHGLRITHADGNGILVSNANNDGIRVVQATNWAGYFNGKAFFGGNVGIGTESPNSTLEVAGVIHSTDGGFKFPDGTTQTTAAIGCEERNTLDQAYDEGGSGAGRTIIADAGAVNIDGPDGLTVNGFVGINTTNPGYELDVGGYVNANGYYTKDIVFEAEGMSVWRMHMDLYSLYLENLISGVTYRVIMLKTSASQDDLNGDNGTPFEQDIKNLQLENEELKQRIEKLELALSQN